MHSIKFYRMQGLVINEHMLRFPEGLGTLEVGNSVL